MKRLCSLLLAGVLALGMLTPAFAVSDEAVQAADALYALGLFNGTGVDAEGKPIYDLDRAPTRNEAITMLVALLGKTEEAKNGTWDIPFTDVADWAKPFVGYAYANGLTSGTSATTYGGDQLVTAAQYLTFVLTALGYKSGVDFQWDKAWELSDKIGLTDGRYNSANNTVLRGDVAIISRSALDSEMKSGDMSLLEVLKQAQKPEVPVKPQKAEEPFNGSVFGDKWLHEYLMSLSPYETGRGSAMDYYWFDGLSVAEQIRAVLDKNYEFRKVTETKGKSSGTRECVCVEPDKIQWKIGVTKYNGDGSTISYDYYLKEEAVDLSAKTAFGDQWLHEYLASLGPYKVFVGTDMDHYYYDDLSIAAKICKALEEKYEFQEIYERPRHETTLKGAFVRVENYLPYHKVDVATFFGNGKMVNTQYYLSEDAG